MQVAQKLTLSHAKQLIQHDVIGFNAQWDVLPHEQFDLSAPLKNKLKYVVFILHPENQHLKRFYGQSSDDFISKSNNKQSKSESKQWMDQEMKCIDKAKEGFNEIFYFLNNHRLVTMVRAHDHFYERWYQFDSSNATCHPIHGHDSSASHDYYCLYMKALNEEETIRSGKPSFDVVGTLAFGVKDMIVNNQKMKMAISGSGWVSNKYRKEPTMVLWYLQIQMIKALGVRYLYGHVFEDNARSLGFLGKSGMIPSPLRLHVVGVNVPLTSDNHLSKSNTTKMQSLDDYVHLMTRIYSDGFSLDRTHLTKLFFHPNFIGCFYNQEHNLTFTVWNYKKAEYFQGDQKKTLNAFLIINMSPLPTQNQINNQIRDISVQQFDVIETALQHEILPNLVLTDHSLPSTECTIVYSTGSTFVRKLICERHLQNPSLCMGSFAYTFQDNETCLYYLRQTQENQCHFERQKNFKSSPPQTEPVWNFIMGGSKELTHGWNLFLDPRDCTSTPLVWSDDIKHMVLESIEQHVQRNETSSRRNTLP
ncbi:hypothetical protein C9374_010028 [Naegleria lovaniensis]|uniref:Uncharacterized protein n=1 Tax=Naegleria lovaniensis TaxID=51637 RepID=A0AA88GGT5_NAELO|nr:uncharacterized protein C9374_010028 [Naegleria lovaniensis]KAG2375024.1 hypothetical protein C9374_010028 [Naegleria lovaniensis]